VATNVRDTRGAQLWPTLGAAEVERLRRFGEVRHYAAGDGAQVVASIHTYLAGAAAAIVREPAATMELA